MSTRDDQYGEDFPPGITVGVPDPDAPPTPHPPTPPAPTQPSWPPTTGQQAPPTYPAQPTYQQPTFQQPTFQQPTHQQPAHQQPTRQTPPAYEQPAYQQPTYPPPAVRTSPPRRARPWGVAAIGIAVIALIAAGIAVVSLLGKRNDMLSAQVGDCARYDSGKQVPFIKTDCADADATFVVLKITKGGDGCKDVPGAQRSLGADDGDFLCLGHKGGDPSTAVNGAAEGDCLAVAGNEATRAPCTSAEATHKITKRLTDVPAKTSSDACAAGEQSYAWAWGTVDAEPSTYDVVLCLTAL